MAKKEIKDEEVQETAIMEIEPMTVAPAQLKMQMKVETERRKVMTDYITENMVDGKDYGKIKIQTKSGGTVESKSTLFKPGAEKFCSLFGLQATFNKDFETWEMLGSQPGVIAFICTLKTKHGTVVGEGRGVADIREKTGWTANNCVKIAEKRAQIDAVLRSGGLSDFFTQDLEDQPDTNYKAGVVAGPANYAPRGGKVSQKQMALMFVMMKERGLTKEKLEDYMVKHLSVIGIENLNFDQASQVINMLKKLPVKNAAGKSAEDELPSVQLDEEDVDGVVGTGSEKEHEYDQE